MAKPMPWEEGFPDLGLGVLHNVEQHMKVSAAVPFGEAAYVIETGLMYGRKHASWWRIRLAGHNQRVLYQGVTRSRFGARRAARRQFQTLIGGSHG